MFRKMMYFAIFAAFVPVAAFAKMEIVQVDGSRHLAAVKSTGENLEPGQVLVATAQDGRQCNLTVRKVHPANVTVDTSNCDFAGQLRAGQTVERSLIEANADEPFTAPTPAPQAAASVRPAQGQSATTYQRPPMPTSLDVTPFAFLDTASELKGTASAGGRSADFTINKNTALGLGIEFSQFNPGSVGFYADLAYELPHDVNSMEINGRTLDFTTKSELSAVILSGGANVSLNENIYLLGGLNFNFPHMSDSDGLSITGKPGLEGGLGFHVSQFNGQLMYRYMAMSGSINGVDLNIRTAGFLLRGGMMF